MLETIEQPSDRMPIVTITGDAGVGKTVLAATFPDCIFIRAEDGLQSIPKDKRPAAFPVLSSVDDLWKQLGALINEDHEYKTLVLDSTTQLETMFHDYILESDPKAKSINQAMGGYGAGYSAIAAMHGRVRKAAKILNERKGMAIVFIAHSDITQIDLPDQDPYSRYELRLHKKSMPHYVDNVDLVTYLKLETFTKGDGDKKKAFSDGTRLAVCYTAAAQISKNRYGITEDLVVAEGENPFFEYVPMLAEEIAQ